MAIIYIVSIFNQRYPDRISTLFNKKLLYLPKTILRTIYGPEQDNLVLIENASTEINAHADLSGAQWLNDTCSVLDSRPRGRGFEPHRRHWVVSLSKTH